MKFNLTPRNYARNLALNGRNMQDVQKFFLNYQQNKVGISVNPVFPFAFLVTFIIITHKLTKEYFLTSY